mgnify:CR=1 FL=1
MYHIFEQIKPILKNKNNPYTHSSSDESPPDFTNDKYIQTHINAQAHRTLYKFRYQ